jgi:hypothetical protein
MSLLISSRSDEIFLLLQANVRNYYMQFEESQTQSAIDDKIMQFAQHARPALNLVSHMYPFFGAVCLYLQTKNSNKMYQLYSDEKVTATC